MNPLDALLQDECRRLLDRIALGSREGLLSSGQGRPDLRERLDRAEERLSLARIALLEGYDEWRRVLEECEGLWALTTLASEEPAPETGLRAA